MAPSNAHSYRGGVCNHACALRVGDRAGSERGGDGGGVCVGAPTSVAESSELMLSEVSVIDSRRCGRKRYTTGAAEEVEEEAAEAAVGWWCVRDVPMSAVVSLVDSNVGRLTMFCALNLSPSPGWFCSGTNGSLAVGEAGAEAGAAVGSGGGE